MSIASEISRINQNIAAAYTACSEKDATMPVAQNSANLADTIDSISIGGTEAEEKDVNFIDWDGTILYSYTEEEVMALTELPPLPVKAGYTYQGWNWTLEQIKANCQPMTVGAIRVPTDGATRFTFELTPGDNMQISFTFDVASNLEVSIDWGDGTSGVYTASPAVHTYSSCGKFVAKISSNQTMSLSNFGTYLMKLKSVEVGSQITTLKQDFCRNYSYLQAVSLPQNLRNIQRYVFQQCFSLIAVNLPDQIQYLNERVFSECYSLRFLSFSGKASSFAFLEYPVASCSSLKYLVLPPTTATFNQSAFSGCYRLSRIIFPSSVTRISDSAFNGCRSLRIVDLSAKTSVPELGRTVFDNIRSDAVIYVKNAEMLAAFQVATNWSNYAAMMQIGGKYAD